MVLARSEAQPGLKGVSLFLLPRELEDGSHNRFRILRLKDKLGTRSMASGGSAWKAPPPGWWASAAAASSRWPT